jgi:hypothetical protein
VGSSTGLGRRPVGFYRVPTFSAGAGHRSDQLGLVGDLRFRPRRPRQTANQLGDASHLEVPRAVGDRVAGEVGTVRLGLRHTVTRRIAEQSVQIPEVRRELGMAPVNRDDAVVSCHEIVSVEIVVREGRARGLVQPSVGAARQACTLPRSSIRSTWSEPDQAIV